MIEIDDRFRKFKVLDAQRRRRNVLRRIVAVVASVAGVSVVVVLLFTQGVLHLRSDGVVPEEYGTDEQPADAAIFVPAFVDLPGDPLRISLATAAGAADKSRLMPRPAGVPPERAPGNVVVLTDTMVAASRQFMATLPSSPQDFAFYQALRVSASAPAQNAPAVFTQTVDDEAPPSEAGQGVGIGDDAALRNTTSVALVLRQDQRVAHDRDYFTKVLATRSLSSTIIENGLSAADAELFDAAMKTLLSKDTLDVGDVVAIRGLNRGPAGMSVMQVSLYSGTSYLGTLARSDDGSITAGSDPWVFEDLFKYSGDENVSKEGQQYRLLDAIYSTALRNDVPTEVLNQAIALLSRSFDLNAFASLDDRLLLAYSPDTEQSADGGVLFVGVQGTGRDYQCFAYKTPVDADYSCSKGTVRAGVASSSFRLPVNGALMEKFGTQAGADGKPRQQKGMEWAAPLGTQVVAAFSGKVTFAGATGDGNQLKISQADGRESWYSPLESFAAGIAVGSAVKAGDLIGYVGSNSEASGPHLHFELHADGVPIDPMTAVEATGSDAAVVEEMTNRIIRIESAGSTTAKNPNSTATGLGQFTEGTWLRMIQTYRRDLSTSMSTAAILDLRFDPDLSREMVRNLAREGDSYLKGKGISVTPGRLYLCHFLGAGTAAIVLAANGSTPLLGLVGDKVISANKFLTNMTAADVEAWSDRLMNRGGSAPPPEVLSPDFLQYRAAVLDMLGGDLGTPGTPPPTNA